MPKVSPSLEAAGQTVGQTSFDVGKKVEKIDNNLPTRKTQHEQNKMPKSSPPPSTAGQTVGQTSRDVGKTETKIPEKLPTSNLFGNQNNQIKMPKVSSPTPTASQTVHDFLCNVGKTETKSLNNLPTWLTPKHENTLYWCVFMLHYGETEYLAIGSKYKNAEVEEKMRVLDGLQKSLKSLKTACYKLTNDMSQQLLSSLMVNVRDDFLTLIGYCVYYNLHIVMLMENNSYLMFSPQPMLELQWNADLPWYQIQCRRGARYPVYSVDTQPLSQSALNDIRNTRVRLHSHTAPLRGASSYRVAELEVMAKRLNLPITGKKDDLYVAIAQHLAMS